MTNASDRAAEIRSALQVNPNLTGAAELQQEISRRVEFIKDAVRRSGTRALVLGISGGVAATTAGRLCQLAVESLREEGCGATFYGTRVAAGVEVEGQAA